MKVQTISITFACMLSLVAGCTGSSNRPVVTADAEHGIDFGSGQHTPAYEISPADGIQLDISHFQFVRNGVAVTPDMVQVGLNSQRYRLSQSIAPITTLDATTLTNIKGTPTFPGFKSGDKFMINVGRVQPNPYDLNFMTFDWEACVVVN